MQQWERIRSGTANPGGSRGIGGADAYSEFTSATDRFAATLKSTLNDISKEAQKFYDVHFAQDDPTPVRIVLGVTRSPSFSGTNLQTSNFRKPRVELHIEVAGNVIKRTQSFLNEAKLTQLALSVRFAASLVNLHESDLKLLVLDDLLVSLDMSNRMKVVEILVSATFDNYQKIILTHDLGVFREFRRIIGPSHTDWCFVRLEGDASKIFTCQSQKTELQKAEEYLHGHSLDEAAICLRKAAEDTAKRYREWAEQKKLPPGKFLTLTENLRAA